MVWSDVINILWGLYNQFVLFIQPLFVWLFTPVEFLGGNFRWIEFLFGSGFIVWISARAVIKLIK